MRGCRFDSGRLFLWNINEKPEGCCRGDRWYDHVLVFTPDVVVVHDNWLHADPSIQLNFYFYFPIIIRVLSHTMRLLETDNRGSSTYHEPTCVLNQYGGGYGRSRQGPIKNRNDQEKKKLGKDLSESGSYNLEINIYFWAVFTLLNFLSVGMRSIPISYWILLMIYITSCPRIVAGLPDTVYTQSKSILLIPAAVTIGVAAGTVTAGVAANIEPNKRKLHKRRSKVLPWRQKTSTFNHAAARAALNLDPTATFQEISFFCQTATVSWQERVKDQDNNNEEIFSQR